MLLDVPMVPVVQPRVVGHFHYRIIATLCKWHLNLRHRLVCDFWPECSDRWEYRVVRSDGNEKAPS